MINISKFYTIVKSVDTFFFWITRRRDPFAEQFVILCARAHNKMGVFAKEGAFERDSLHSFPRDFSDSCMYHIETHFQETTTFLLEEKRKLNGLKSLRNVSSRLDYSKLHRVSRTISSTIERNPRNLHIPLFAKNMIVILPTSNIFLRACRKSHAL